eukprot:COSAG02_NODE_2793_length_8017_cov_6.303738_1_plen_82_part_00
MRAHRRREHPGVPGEYIYNCARGRRYVPGSYTQYYYSIVPRAPRSAVNSTISRSLECISTTSGMHRVPMYTIILVVVHVTR